MEQQYETITHELGHALGFMGHSLNTTHLMYATQHNDCTIKETEKNHLKQIYDYYR